MGSNGQHDRSAVLTTGAMLVCLVGAWLLATAHTGRTPAWKVQVRTDTRRPEHREVRNGAHVSGSAMMRLGARWEQGDTSWRLTLPAQAAATRSGWLVRVRCTQEARDHGVRGLSLWVNGRQVAGSLAARRELDLEVSRAFLRDGENTVEVRSPWPDAFYQVQVRNHVTIHDWWPVTHILATDGLHLRPLGARDVAWLALMLAGGAAALVVLSRLWCRRTGVPMWTARQWRRTCWLLMAPAGFLAVANQLPGHTVVVDQWSAALLVGGLLAVSGSWCAWRNFRAARWADLDESVRGRLLEARHVVVLSAVTWLVYNANMDRVGEIDGEPAPRIAISLLRQGDMDLTEYTEYQSPDEFQPLMRTGGRWASRWPPGTGLVCVPFFALPVLLGVEAPSISVSILMKLVGSTLTALSAVFVYLGARRVATRRGATWVTLAYALGTAALSISAQDTWQHGPAQLCLAAMVYTAMCRPRHAGWHVLNGFLLGMLAVIRPPAALLAVPLCLWVAYVQGVRKMAWYVAGAFAPLAFLAAYNSYFFGSPGFGGYEDMLGGGWHVGGMPMALLGMLMSPNRGMLVFSPFLVMMAYGAVAAAGRHARQPGDDSRWLAAACVAGIVIHLLVTAAWQAWDAFISYGSRYSADAMPYWALVGAFGVDRILSRVLWRRVFVGLVCLSVFIQSLGVYVRVHPWNTLMMEKYDLKMSHGDMGPAVWDVEDWQVLWQIRYALGLLDED